MEVNTLKALARFTTQAGPGDAPVASAGVTIAIPNWNHELVLPRSISAALDAVAVLADANIPAEVLVIDDRSRDGSLTLLRQFEALYAGAGLRVVALARNGGLPVARNTALRYATYRHIAFVDADNELVSENLLLFYRAASDTAAAVVYGNLLWQQEDGDTDTGVVKLISNTSVQTEIFHANYIDAFALFDRLQIADVDGYLAAPEIAAREDWELYAHLVASGRRIVFVPAVFGIYHELAGSMIQEAAEHHDAQAAYIRRVFDQLGLRDQMPMNTRHLRYHPDIGYL